MTNLFLGEIFPNKSSKKPLKNAGILHINNGNPTSDLYANNKHAKKTPNPPTLGVGLSWNF